MSIADEIRKLAELRDAGHLSPAEFEAAKARILAGDSPAGGTSFQSFPNSRSNNSGSGIDLGKLRRTRGDSWIGGVCGGLAVFTGTESWLWRLVFVVAFFCGGFGLLPYILLWIFVPLDQSV